MSDPESTRPCSNCGKATPSYLNFCEWSCHVEAAKKHGGKVLTPNGLPIRCISHDGTMLECEHGDHPDYQFPVDVEYCGPEEDKPHWVGEGGVRVPPSEEDDEMLLHETHALLYSDGYIAVTLYECVYAMWEVDGGKILAGRMWKPSHWRLTEESRNACLRFRYDG